MAKSPSTTTAKPAKRAAAKAEAKRAKRAAKAAPTVAELLLGEETGEVGHQVEAAFEA